MVAREKWGRGGAKWVKCNGRYRLPVTERRRHGDEKYIRENSQ